MKIVNPSVRKDIERNRPLRLDLGCGPVPKEGFYGVDILKMKGVDIVADINKPFIGFPDNSVIEVYSSHAFEHITNFQNLMSELWRIVKPNGHIKIVVPHFSNPLGYSDPTHVRFFGLYSMYYFVEQQGQLRNKVPNFYTNIRFKIESILIKFGHGGLNRLFGSLIERLVNLSNRTQAFYERHLCWLWPASEVVYVLSPNKQIELI